MGWWITLGIVVLLAILPLGASISYDDRGAIVKVIIGPLKITVFPRKKKDKKSKKDQKKTEEAPAKEETKKPAAKAAEPKPSNEPKAPEPPKPVEEKKEDPASTEKAGKEEKKPSGGPVTDFLPLVKTALDMLNAFRRRLRVNYLELKVIMAGDDPADLAINYGRAWTALGNFLPKLEKFLVIKKRNIEVECDFMTNQTLIIARLDLTITLGRILATVVVYGLRALIQFLKINKKRKGGAAK